jgi:hypothetical protein
MPLEVSKPAVAAEKAVRSMLARIVATDADYVPALRSSSLDSLAISTPHLIAVIALDRIRAGMSLRSAARKKGWRFFVHHRDKVVATINSGMRGNGRHGFSNITAGRFVAGTERAIRRAELLEPVRKGRFEPVLLQVPVIHLVALWLKNLDTEDDLIMPIRPAPKPLRANHALSTPDFVAAIAELASRARRDHAEARRR